MPEQSFSVHVDPDTLARQGLTLTVALAAGADRDTDRPATTPGARHGAHDDRAAARLRSGRERSQRAARAGGGRSYAFRRS